MRWDDYYGLSDGQMQLAQSLLDRRLADAGAPILLSPQEAGNLYGDIVECAASLQELNIFLPTPEMEHQRKC